MATFVQEKQEPEALRAALAGALGALVGRCSEADAAEVLAQFVSGATDVVRERIHFQALVLAGAAKFAAAKTIQVKRSYWHHG